MKVYVICSYGELRSVWDSFDSARAYLLDNGWTRLGDSEYNYYCDYGECYIVEQEVMCYSSDHVDKE